MTAQPVRRPIPISGGRQNADERPRYRDFTTNLGGPAVRDRLWFLAGYQHLRDYDSQPGASPAFPRTYMQDKIFAKLTWKLAPGWNLIRSVHDEFDRACTSFPEQVQTRTYAATLLSTMDASSTDDVTRVYARERRADGIRLE